LRRKLTRPKTLHHQKNFHQLSRRPSIIRYRRTSS